MQQGFFENVAIGWLFLASVVIFFAAAEVGYRVGARTGKAGEESNLGVVLGGLLGLLAILLGFTVSMAGNRFETRRSLVVQEANAVGTAWLRTDLLPEPQRTEARALLREYASARLEVARPGMLAQALQASRRIQDRLWAIGAAEARERPTPTSALVVASLNDLIDRDGDRQGVAFVPGVPATLIATLYLVAILVMGAVGLDGGLRGSRGVLSTLVLVLSLATVTILVQDLDRPQQGLLRVSQKPMADLRASMGPGP
jgi:hypothetical protein